MHLVMFHFLFPEIADHETRFLTLTGYPGLPDGQYSFAEAYCPDPKCHCRRVMLNLFDIHRQKQVATISYGFDRDKPQAGPFLDPFNPQSEFSAGFLKLIGEILEKDPAYVARLKRHYQQIKKVMADPSHPAHQKLKQLEREVDGETPKPRQRRWKKF